MALLVWQRPNLLLLDEPTNHLDLEMRHALTMALQTFEGAMMIVSHDRHLLRLTCSDYYLVDKGIVQSFDGDLDDYHQWLLDAAKENKADLRSAKSSDNTSDTNNGTLDKKAQKRQEAELRKKLSPLKKQQTKLETQQHKINEKLGAIEEILANSDIYRAENKKQLTETLTQRAELIQVLEESEMEWLELQESIEEIELEG